MNVKSDFHAAYLMKILATRLGLIVVLTSLLPACQNGKKFDLEFTWEKIPSDAPPVARMDAAMASDSATGRLYMFGGRSETGCLNDLWSYKPGRGWSSLNKKAGPSARSGASMAIEPGHGRLVLFGGYCSNSEGQLEFNKEIWFYSEKNGWNREYIKGGPSARAWQSMTSTDDGAILIFGGVTPPPSFHRNDLWRLDLEQLQWNRVANDGGPLMAGRSALLSVKKQPLLVFGRIGVRKSKNTGTFRLQQMDWTQLDTAPAEAPPTGFDLALANNTNESLMVLRGQNQYSSEISWDLWQRIKPWNETAHWLHGHTNSGPEFALGMACSPEPGSDSLICFGGARGQKLSNETWRLKITGYTGYNGE